MIAAVAALLIAGCSGGFGPTLPSPDGAVGPSGQLCVQVLEGIEQLPLPDAYVYVGATRDPAVLERDETNEEGLVCFDEIPAGLYAVTASAEGYRTIHTIVQVTGEDQTVQITLGQLTEGNPTECPEVTVNAGEVNETAGTVVLSGTVTNSDSDTLIIFQGGQPTVTSVAPNGSFSQLFFLAPGVNTFQVLVSNAACTILYPEEPIEVQWQPEAGADFYFRVTMTWDEGTSDPDLHTWTPGIDEHSAYWHKAVSVGQLDRDDTQGFGPENFTCTGFEEGRFRIAVNSYDLDEATSYNVTLRVITGGLAANTLVRTVGPHTFSTDNGEGYPVEPPNWWRPFDIVVASDGTVSVVPPDDATLPANPSGTTASAVGTK